MKRALLCLCLAACGRSASTIPDPDPTKQPLVGCEGKSVIALDGRTLVRIDASGIKKLFTFGDGFTDDQVAVDRWELAGNFIGGVALAGPSSSNSYPYEYVLLDLSGKVLFHRAQVQSFSPNLYVGEDGSLAVAEEVGWVAHSDGSVTDLGDILPVTAVLPDGSLVAARGKLTALQDATVGLWKGGAFTALATSPASAYALHRVGARVLYLDGAALVSATDGRRIALPAADLGYGRSAGDRWVLLYGDASQVLVDLEQGTAHSVSTVPAPAIAQRSWSAGLQSDGAVLAGTAKDGQLQLMRTTNLGAAWDAVGEPMQPGEDFGLGQWLAATEHSGSVLAVSVSTGYGDFLKEVQLVSAWGTHTLDAGGLYVNTDWSPGGTDLSSDGQCAAVWVQHQLFTSSDLVFLAADGKQATVVQGHAPAWLRFAP